MINRYIRKIFLSGFSGVNYKIIAVSGYNSLIYIIYISEFVICVIETFKNTRNILFDITTEIYLII